MNFLGCAQKYTAVIHHQGGAVPFYQIPSDQVAEITWQRILDDTSKASVRIKRADASAVCCQKVGELDCWGYELSIYRDGDLVWQGPIYDILEDPNDIFIEARDVIGFLDHRMNNIAYDASNVDLGIWFSIMVSDGFSLQDPNVMTWVSIEAGTGPTVIWNTPINTVYVGDEIRELAKAGYDFTTIGRRIIGRFEKNAEDYTDLAPVLTQDHFAGLLQIRKYGAGTVTRAHVIGDGVSSTVGLPVHPFYGVVDVIEHMDTQTDVNITALAAARLYNEGNPTPTFIVFPEEARLLPTAPITIPQLVCGERIDVFVNSGFCRDVRQAFKLLQVNGRWTTDQGETIGISVGPLPSSAP